MKKSLMYLISATLAASMATLAMAQSANQSGVNSDSSFNQASSSTNIIGQHQMSGTVSEVNKTQGTVKIRTGDAPLILHFPSDVLNNFKKGDAVTVHLGISNDSGVSGSKSSVRSKTENNSKYNVNTGPGPQTIEGSDTGTPSTTSGVSSGKSGPPTGNK